MKLSSLRTALDHCREHIDTAHVSPHTPTLTLTNTFVPPGPSLTLFSPLPLHLPRQSKSSSSSLTPLSESSLRLRGILTELNSVDKQLSNTGISYASEERGGQVTESDLPAAGGETSKPSHRQVSALRTYCQDLLVKCDEEKADAKAAGRPAKPIANLEVVAEEEKEEAKGAVRAGGGALQVDADSPRSSADQAMSSPSASTFTSEEDKAVVGETVALALANEPLRNSAAGAAAAAQAEQRAQNQKVGGPPPGTTKGGSALDVFTISRWGELLRESKKPLNKDQLKKKQIQMERDEEREIKCHTPHTHRTPHTAHHTPHSRPLHSAASNQHSHPLLCPSHCAGSSPRRILHIAHLLCRIVHCFVLRS